MDSYDIYFMTSSEGFGISFAPITPDNGTVYIELLCCFGEIEGDKLEFEAEQRATNILKGKISDFVDRYSSGLPQLNRLKSKISKLSENEYFLVLQNAPTDTQTKVDLELIIAVLNDTSDKDQAEKLFLERKTQFDEFVGDLLSSYDMSNVRNDQRVLIGNKAKDNRCCRFCDNTKREGATFKKIAHAIPEGLGNKNIILADECDTCNEYFGDNIEPALIENLDIYRVFLGVQGKNGIPKIKYKNGHMENSNGGPVVVSTNIEKVSDREFKVHFEANKKVKPVNIYKTLCKMTLSTLETFNREDFKKTIDWLRNDNHEEVDLPLVAINVLHSGFSKEPQISNYIRKEDSPDCFPYIVSEFRVGSFVYVYILPFCSKDSKEFVEKPEYDKFWEKFSHYSQTTGWRFDNYKRTKEMKINETIRMVQSDQKTPIDKV